MRQIYLARNLSDAHLTVETLRLAGIDAVVHGDSIPVASNPFPSVWVEDADAERAREILGASEDAASQ